MHKVYKYLIKKLSSEKVIDDLPDDQPADSLVEILCNGTLLNPYILLKSVKEKYWQKPDQLLVLHYRRKETVSASESSRVREYCPRKPPLWIPDHLALQCMKCEQDFTMWRRVHHCRNCGKCFCGECCGQWARIEKYGYFQPVRVCAECKKEVERRRQ